jgi:hypothetical protein
VVRLAVALVGVVAAGLGPYPAQHQGSGREKTAGSGIFAGTRFVPRSALSDYEIGPSCCPQKTIGEVNVFLSERPSVTCRSLEAAKSKRFFSYTVETDGNKLPTGRVAPSSFFQQASFNIVGLTTGFQPGVSIVFTRIDTSPGGVWHGRINVPRQTYNHKTYALTGTFAARWCGTKRS